MAEAETWMTGREAVRGSTLIRSHTSKPVMSGSRTSTSTTSGLTWGSAARARPSWPSAASTTWWPARRRVVPST